VLCSSCGSEQRFKYGKWRPCSFFMEGRLTCFLAHKIFSKSASDGVESCTWELSSTMGIEMDSLLNDCLLSMIEGFLSQAYHPKIDRGFPQWDNVAEVIQLLKVFIENF
jgi:hypothetical protein